LLTQIVIISRGVRNRVRNRLIIEDAELIVKSKPNVLGDLLRRVREEKGLTLPLMAEKLGISKNTLGDFEREKRLADIEFLATFARVTGWDEKKLLEARLRAAASSPQWQNAIKAIGRARDAAVEFALKRSSITPEDYQTVMQAAFDRGLDTGDLEREFGARLVRSPVKSDVPMFARQTAGPYSDEPAGDAVKSPAKLVRDLAMEIGFDGSTDSLLMLVELMARGDINEIGARCVLQHLKSTLKED
jgi:transcriptional regulator with XRE-family HTH domain